ncbi:MAG: hypothetical protein HY428_03080 [Candidatus Levybacteria bacterium]|nr:hypothetical protein [Candidatus Levybacteria bacterium]
MDQRKPLFLYGIMQSDDVFASVVGEPLQRTPATLNDFALYVQRIDQVPDTAPSHLPSDLAPQRILRKNWDGNFESYMVRPKNRSQVFFP